MAEFINPFTGVIPDRKLTLRELTRAIRQFHRYEFAVSESVALQLHDPSAVCVLT